MLHEAIFRATCNAAKVALQFARKNSRVTPHFARKVERVARVELNKLQDLSWTILYFSLCCEPSCSRVRSPQQLTTQFCQNGPIGAHLSLALQVAKKVANVWHPLCNLKGFLYVIVTLQVARKIASYNMALIREMQFEPFAIGYPRDLHVNYDLWKLMKGATDVFAQKRVSKFLIIITKGKVVKSNHQ